MLIQQWFLVDGNLKIRLFNPAAEKILNLMPGQIGLPIASVTMGIIVEDLEKTVSEVIASNNEIAREVRDKAGRVFEMRVRPYFIEKDRIDGAVLTFSDINERKTLNEREIESIAKFPSQNPNPIFRIDEKGTIKYGNPAGNFLFAEWNSKIGDKAPAHIRRVVVEALASNKRIELEETYGANTFSFLFVPITLEGYVNIYATDITGRKKAETQIVEQLHMLDLAHIIVKNMKDEIIFWNLGVQRMYGFSKKEALGKVPRELLKTVFPKPFKQIKEELLRTGKWEGELIHRKADGSTIYVASSWVLHKDSNGKPMAIIEVNNDITDRKKAEEALSRANEELEERVRKRTTEVSSERQRLYNVLETLPAYVVLLDKDYCVPFANKVFRERFGESKGRHCYDFLFKRDSPCENCESYKVMKTNKPHHWEWAGPDGRDYDIYDFPFVEADGSILILEMGIDITERKRAEKQIQAVSLYSRSLIEASLDPLVTISKEGKITDVNNATEEVTGCLREELIGSDFSDYFTEPQQAREGYKKVFTEGLVKDYPLEIKHKTGRITKVLYNASIYRSPQGEIQGVFAAARDITELKKTEEEALESAKKLKDAERLAAIGATAGMVGHDIRNPLQAITSDVYLAKTDLASTSESEEKKNALESLDEIEKNVGYINKIVADLQDYARPIQPIAKETDAQKLIDEILAKNGIPESVKVEVIVQKEAGCIMADSDILKRILGNLVINAVQAMPKGGKLSIHAYKEAEDSIITVEDTGVGIPKEVKDKLFTPLFTTKSKGQGFGLAVVKRMTESLGGTVKFESEEGRGTKFIIRFPPQRKR